MDLLENYTFFINKFSRITIYKCHTEIYPLIFILLVRSMHQNNYQTNFLSRKVLFKISTKKLFKRIQSKRFVQKPQVKKNCQNPTLTQLNSTQLKATLLNLG